MRSSEAAEIDDVPSRAESTSAVANSMAETPCVSRLDSCLPAGYRQAFATASAVLLTFALAFVRLWVFDGEQWKKRDWLEGFLIATAIGLLMLALFRGLRLEDENPLEYSRTVRWLLFGTGALFAAIVGTAIPNVR